MEEVVVEKIGGQKIVIGKSSSDKISNMLKILSCNDIKFSYSMQFAPGTLS